MGKPPSLKDYASTFPKLLHITHFFQSFVKSKVDRRSHLWWNHPRFRSQLKLKLRPGKAELPQLTHVFQAGFFNAIQETNLRFSRLFSKVILIFRDD